MIYTQESIHQITENQRSFFHSGATLDPDWRILQLQKLKNAIIRNEEQLEAALKKDLNRSVTESYLCDIGPSIMEINEMIRNLKRWSRPEKHFSGLHCFPSTVTYVYKIPYGVSLLISPFNFPVVLSFGVLAASIAGGNTAVIKVSSKSPCSSAAIKTLIAETFPENYITVIEGGHDIADLCLAEQFDKIFYTGSPAVGKHVLKAAAEHLTSAALELGGETGNWCIIRRDADLDDAARKIAFFKLCNAGQICININQIAIAEEIADEFLEKLKKAFIQQIGENSEKNEEYSSLITEQAYNKCSALVEEYRNRVLFGGTGDSSSRRFSPTIIYPVKPDEKIVLHENFCPLLPVIPYADDRINDLLQTISEREHALALYLFTKDLKWAKKVMQSQQYGGGCINEVCIHMMVNGVPFNGTGHSGMGAYHGIWGFREFTHPSTVLVGSTHLNLSIREHPYSGRNEKLRLKILRLLER